MHGSNLWGDRYDRDLGDIFALQDDITRSVLSAIEPTMRLVEIERTRAKPTESLQAYDLYLRALPALAAYTRDGFRRAEELLTEAIARDATFAEALASLADSLFRQVVNGWHDLAKGKEARVLALRAAQLDPANGQALSIASFVLAGLEGRRTEGNELADRALDLHPNSAFVRTNCGWTYIYSCNPELALAQFHEARRMSPLDPRSSHTFNGIAVALFCLERYDEALLWVERARQQSPSQNVSRRWAAAILVQLGRLDEAREIVSEMCRLAPEYTITRLASHSIRCEPAMSRYLAALRAAGVPE
jgi:adenylate cyclase